MKKIIKHFALGSVWATAGAAVMYLAAVSLPTERVSVAMDACGYIPHPISDMAWEFYARSPQRYMIGSAWYYTSMMNSRNADAADCMVWQLDADYARSRGYSK